MEALRNLILPDGAYLQKLFDPVQTHGLYGIGDFQVEECKKKLKEIGANRFRIVKAHGNRRILCFKFVDKSKS